MNHPITLQQQWDAIFGYMFDRAAAGFPPFSDWIMAEKQSLLSQISGLASNFTDKIISTPVELKDTLIRYCNEISFKAGPRVKMFMAFFLKLIPYVTNDLWNTLGQNQQIASRMQIKKPAEEFEAHEQGTDHTLLASGADTSDHTSHPDFLHKALLAMLQAAGQ